MKPTNRIALALVLPLLALPACSKEKKAEPETTEPGAKDEAKEKIEAPIETAPDKTDKIELVPTAASPELGAVLKHMPIDTEIMVSLNMTSLTNTALWEKLGPAAMAKASGGLDKAEATCGFNPFTSLGSIHLGINSKRDDEPVIMVRGLSREPLVSCIKKISAQEKAELEVSEDGAFTTLKSKKEGQTQVVIWLDDASLLMVPGKEDKAYLQARADGNDSLTGNAGFLIPASKAAQTAPIWFAGHFGPSSKAAKGMASMGSQPKALYGSVGFTEGIQFNLGVSYDSPEAAQQTVGQVKGMMGMAKGSLGPMAGLVDKTQLSTDGADMTISLDMNKQEVDQLSNMASMFAPK